MTSGAPTYTLDELGRLEGEQLGASEWAMVDQGRINLFAEATDDHQWIHVDPERAKSGPYGRTIAHGYLTLALLPALVSQAFTVEGIARRVNYGLDKVRFPSPVPVDSRVRAVVHCRAAKSIDGGRQLALRVVVEAEGQPKPACVADTITLLIA